MGKIRSIVEMNGEKHEVEILQESDRIKAVVGDREYDLEYSTPEPGVHLFKDDGQISEAFTFKGTDGRVSLRVGTEDYLAKVVDPKKLRGFEGSTDAATGRAEIRTAMPGKVVRILVSVGDAVQKGDGVIVVEAMKMQNEMRSPKDGVISEIKAAENDTVGAGDVLIIID